METKLFRVRVKDGLLSPVKPGITNVHGIDMGNVIVPAKVALAIIGKRIRYQDAVRCVLAGKDPTVLLTAPSALKPREELENAPGFNPEKETAELAPKIPKGGGKVGELVLARQEGRAPDVAKLTEEEQVELAGMLEVDPSKYTTTAGLLRALKKALGATSAPDADE